MFCPYCGKDFPENEIFTKEHIVPDAIGGSLNLSILVCNPCNSVLGTRVDGPFLKDFFIANKRVELELVGQSGKPPELIFTGTMSAFDKRIQGDYSVTPGSKKLHAHKPVEQNEGNIGIVGGEAQVNRILRQMKNSYEEQGLSITDMDVSKQVPEMHASFEFSMSVLDRAFVKMALGLGHRQLGEKFSRSSDAQRLRDFMWDEDCERREAMKLHGSIRIAPEELGELFKYEDAHVTALVNTGEALAFFGLVFGQYQGMIQLCSPPVEGITKDGWVFVTHPRTREVESYSIPNYLEKNGRV